MSPGPAASRARSIDEFIPFKEARDFGALPGSIMLGTATVPVKFEAKGIGAGYIFTNITEGFFSP